MVFDFQVAVLQWRTLLSHHDSRGITTLPLSRTEVLLTKVAIIDIIVQRITPYPPASLKPSYEQNPVGQKAHNVGKDKRVLSLNPKERERENADDRSV